MNDDLTTLASTYLDGEATADERALVEADTNLLAEVERLRQVRAVIGDVEPAPISMRERHLAAALDSWDRIPAPERSLGPIDPTPVGADAAAVAGAASVTAPISLEARRRSRRSGRILALAAGLVLVLAGGLIARSALRTTDDNVANDASQAPTADAELSARAELEVSAAEELFGADAVSDDDAPAATAGATAADGDAFLGVDEAPPDDGLTVLQSREDLAAFADLLIRQATPTEVISDDAVGQGEAPTADVPPAFSDCDLVDDIVGPALWEADGLFDVEVVVGIDNRVGEAIAYEPDSCNVVARTPLLTP